MKGMKRTSVWLTLCCMFLLFSPPLGRAETQPFEPGKVIGVTSFSGTPQSPNNIADDNLTTTTTIATSNYLGLRLSQSSFVLGKIFYKGAQHANLILEIKKMDNTTVYYATTNLSNEGYTIIAEPYEMKGAILRNTSGTSKVSYELDLYEKDTLPPGEVNGLLTSSTQSTVNLEWQNPSDSDLKSIKIYRSGSFIATVNAPNHSYTDSGLTPGSENNYKITTVDQSGNESSGQTVSVWTQSPDTDPPSDVSNVQTTIYDDRIKMTWTNPPDNDFIEVRIFKEGILHAVVTTPATQFMDMDLDINTTYTYLLRSRDGSGNMSAGKTVTATTSGLPGTPTGFYGLPDSQKIQLFWDDMSWSDTNLKPSQGQGGYNVYQDGVKINSTPITTTNYEVTGLTDGTAYTFSVSSVDDLAHESPRSQEITVTPISRTIPNKPILSYQPSHNKITLTWDPVQFAEHYEIYKESDGTVSLVDQVFFEVAQAAGTMMGSTAETSYVVDQDPETTATYSVVAVNELGNSEPATVEATTTAVPINIDLTTNTSFSANDVFDSGLSLASNFWPFLLLGLSFVVVPWIYITISKATKTAKEGETAASTNSRGQGRELNREIRMQLRKGD